MSDQRHVPEREARFIELYEATYADLLRFIQRRVHPTHAEDVAADAFLVAWRRLDDLPDQTGDARAWLVPGDELENAVGEGVEAEVTYRDGTSGTATLGLGTG